MIKLVLGASASMALVGAALLGAPRADSDATLKATLVDATGATLGSAKLSFEPGATEVKVDVQLSPAQAGFHGFHIHSVGRCEAPFASAGGHLGESPGDPAHRHRNHDGDLPVLLVNADGRATARVVTDRLDIAELRDGDGAAFIIHAAPDNYANIPATDATGAPRYTNAGSVAVYPNLTTDAATLATGDAGARVACGVIE